MNRQRDQQLKKIRKVGLDSYLIIENKDLCGVSSRFFLDEKMKKRGKFGLDSYLIMKNKNLGGLSIGFFLDEKLVSR